MRPKILWLLGAYCLSIGYFVDPNNEGEWSYLAIAFIASIGLIWLTAVGEWLVKIRQKRMNRLDYEVEGEAVALEDANVASLIQRPDAVVVR